MDENIRAAAKILEVATAVVVTAGAGMSVDSGLPDFRGNEGFWKAYPPFRKMGLSFEDLANPQWFESDPALAWGFYGHRLNLYRKTKPHPGYSILLRWMSKAPMGGFVYTSNVDGAFVKAGLDPSRVVECHGSIHHAQCTRGCLGIVKMAEGDVAVNEDTFTAEGPLPRCRCGGLLRPNILMFFDVGWSHRRTGDQEERFTGWLDEVRNRFGRVAVVEVGAGKAIPTVRSRSENLAKKLNGALIRINPTDPDGPPGTISIPMGGLAALRQIDEEMKSL